MDKYSTRKCNLGWGQCGLHRIYYGSAYVLSAVILDKKGTKVLMLFMEIIEQEQILNMPFLN